MLVDRVLLPVIDKEGKIALIQGRVLEDKSRAPKYRNFPKDADKSLYLYGEHLIDDDTRILVVIESQIGTVLANQLFRDKGMGTYLAVGLMGSKPSADQLNKLVEFGRDEVVVFLDDDPPGKVGTKLLVEGLRYRTNVSVIRYPPDKEGADPDVLGPEMFLRVLEARKSYVEDRLARIFAKSKDEEQQNRRRR